METPLIIPFGMMTPKHGTRIRMILGNNGPLATSHLRSRWFNEGRPPFEPFEAIFSSYRWQSGNEGYGIIVLAQVFSGLYKDEGSRTIHLTACVWMPA